MGLMKVTCGLDFEQRVKFSMWRLEIGHTRENSQPRKLCGSKDVSGPCGETQRAHFSGSKEWVTKRRCDNLESQVKDMQGLTCY